MAGRFVGEHIQSTDIKIDGDKELIAQFKMLGKGLGGQALTYATMQGANVIKREASARAVRGRSGKLKRGMRSVVMKTKIKLVTVAVSYGEFYGLFVEKGTKKRQQKTQKEYVRKSRTKSGIATGVLRNRKTIASYVPKNTGTMGKQPFLIPAYDAKRRQAADVIKKELWRIIMKLKKRGMAGG